MPDLNWSFRACQDLRSMNGWLGRDVDADMAAICIERIAERTTILADYPFIGAVDDRDMGRSRIEGLPYPILYRVCGERVDIPRIRHVREDRFGVDDS